MTTGTAAPPRPPQTRSRTAPLRPTARAVPGQRWLAAAFWLVAAGLVALALLGPVGFDAVQWRMSMSVHNQLLGLDAVSLIVVAPLAAWAGVLTWRGRALGPLLGLGPATYTVYMVPQYVLGPEYLRIDGDNERLFPLLLVLFIAALVAAVAAWGSVRLGGVTTPWPMERLVGRVLLPLFAFAAFSRYLASVPDMMSATPTGKDYLAGPGFVWTITLLDLGVALPATVATWLGLRRGASWARPALYAVVSWFALVGVAVAAMAIAMQANDDPAMTAGAMTVMVVLGCVMSALAVLLFGPVLRRAR